jgi:hypothetical protein
MFVSERRGRVCCVERSKLADKRMLRVYLEEHTPPVLE